MWATLSGLGYFAIVSLLSLNKVFRRSPFAILFCFFTFLYFNIPAAFILVEGSEYIYGEGLVSIPFTQSDYQQALPLGFLFLLVSWVAVWGGIIFSSTRKQIINRTRFSSIKLLHILIIGIIVLVITWLDNQRVADVHISGEGGSNSLGAFIFFDHAYLVMAGLLLFFKLNEPRFIGHSRNITLLISAIFIGYISIFFLAGSKAAILVIFILLVFFPFCYFRIYPHARCSFPSPKYLVMLAILTLPLFYLALIQRISLSSGITPNLNVIFAGIAEIDVSLAYDIAKQIFYRFSQGGIDRFLLIFQSFVYNEFDPNTALEFVSYIAKNTLNLVLPGTPFPESYAPSSQLFHQVLEHNLIAGEIDSIQLLKSLNTQPYTIFGIFMVISGLFAPLFLFIFSFVIIFVFNKLDNIFVKITIIYFFSSALSSYGIEVAFGNSVHLLVSILIMYLLMKMISKYHRWQRYCVTLNNVSR